MPASYTMQQHELLVFSPPRCQIIRSTLGDLPGAHVIASLAHCLGTMGLMVYDFKGMIISSDLANKLLKLRDFVLAIWCF